MFTSFVEESADDLNVFRGGLHFFDFGLFEFFVVVHDLLGLQRALEGVLVLILHEGTLIVGDEELGIGGHISLQLLLGPKIDLLGNDGLHGAHEEGIFLRVIFGAAGIVLPQI